ncbi:MAG: Asp-tRNA(Asn)/Glu-tRNA(Gln) amidotransferase subunit GatC [Nitrospirae bacterium]|nr:MAG: Asp-tRNA(Asn)/Glu-tRNA(Gln) amidotransferase subunit GatC [Nitrospirota bacterium]
MRLSEAEVEHVGALARLALTPDEKEAFRLQLSRILTYMDELRVVNTDGITPMSGMRTNENVFRSDEPQEAFPQEQALANAPDSQDGYFRVPKILRDR